MDIRKTLTRAALFGATLLFGMSVSYHISVMSGLLLMLQETRELSLLEKQHLVSIILLGALVGVLLAGPLSDRYGRKKGWLVASFFYLGGSVLSYYASSIALLISSRFIIGVGIGLSSVVIPIYLAEAAEAKHRGMMVSSFQLFVTLGILLSYFINWAFVEKGEIAFLVGFYMALVGLFFLCFIPESESFLSYKKKKVRLRSFMKEGGIKTLFVGVILSLFQQITGINTVIYYAPTLFHGMGELSLKLFATLGLGIINVIATILALFFVDRLGRRLLLMIGIGGMIFSLLALVLFGEVPLISFVSLTSYVVFFAVSLGPVTWVVISEIFPMAFRGKAVSLALVVNWLANYLITFFFLDLITRFGMVQLFSSFCFLSFLAFLFVYFCVPETKGITLLEKIE